MKKKILLSFIACLSAFVGMTTFFQGCETESASDNFVEITPEYSFVEEGQSVVLAASGGYSYEWSLSNTDWGLLTEETDTTVKYTSTYQGSSDNEVQTVTVRSYIEGASSSTNSTTYEHFAYAYITHYAGLSISPDSATVALNASITFTASGGDPDEYSWSLSEPSWGVLTRNGSSATYTRSGGPNDGIQILSLSFNNSKVYATIQHTGTDVTLSISPTSASVNSSGDIVSFTASGDDDESYSWWLANDSWGELTQGSDTQVSYLWNGSGDGETQILYCRNAGQTVEAAISQGEAPSSLSINPSQVDVMYLGQVTFTASGGVEDTYEWGLSEPTWGTMTQSSVNKSVYTRTIEANGGIQYITLENGSESVQAVAIHVDTNGIPTPPTP
ncbi:MAG: hypothetical protein PF692_00645 [Kiritimatiellae bacterium]|jgi:hypothetical protein|nr:hypothetical protein [Kiritimatiellia bacterium]